MPLGEHITPPRTAGGVPNFFEKEAALEYFRCALRDMKGDSVLPLLPGAIAFLERARIRARAYPYGDLGNLQIR